ARRPQVAVVVDLDVLGRVQRLDRETRDRRLELLALRPAVEAGGVLRGRHPWELCPTALCCSIHPVLDTRAAPSPAARRDPRRRQVPTALPLYQLDNANPAGRLGAS